MNKLKVLFLGSLLIILFSQTGCKSTGNPMKGDVDIIAAKDGQDPSDNLSIHKNRDVEVFMMKNSDTTDFMWKGNIYSIHYYQIEKDSLQSHKAWIISNEVFDKAGFSWLSDTSVSVRLYNKLSGKESVHELFGFGRSSGMMMKDSTDKAVK